jgi:stalled ribosome alternative rescue factor ArfA
MSKRNPIAQDLRSSKYRIRIVKAKKGKGSYDRKKSLD